MNRCTGTSWCFHWTTLLLAALSCSAAGRANTEDLFDSIYGESVKAAVSPAQKVELARQLTEAAEPLKDREFQALLFRKAYDLALSAPPHGFPVAIKAMDDLSNARPELAGEADKKALSVLERECQSGSLSNRRFAADEYLDRLLPLVRAADEGANETMIQKAMPVAELAGRGWTTELSDLSRQNRQRQAVRRTVETLQAQFQQNPHDVALATKLALALALELDRPEEALAYADPIGEPTRRVLAWATKPAASLSGDQLLAVGQWYKDHAGTAAGLRQAVALRRARLYFQCFLNGHAEPDAIRLQATAALAEIARTEARDKTAAGPLIDLLAMIVPTRDALAGTWAIQDGKVISAPGPSSHLLIPYEPPAEYNFKVTFERSDKTAEFLFFPFARRETSWTCSCWDGVTSGFELVGGKDSRSNPTSRRLPQSNAPGPHTVEIRVRVDSVSTFFDGKLVVRHMTNGADLSGAGPATGIYSLGVGAGNAPASGTTFSRIEVFEVNGRGRPLKHPR